MFTLVKLLDSALMSLSVRFSVVEGSWLLTGSPTSMDRPIDVAAGLRLIEPVPLTEPLEPKKSISLPSITISPAPVST